MSNSQDKDKPKVDKASLEASKKQHDKAINNNSIIVKDGKDTGRPKG